MRPVRFTLLDDAIARVEIVRETRGNSLNPNVLRELERTIRLAAEKGARVGVLRGKGDRNFCTGYDLSRLSKPLDPKKLHLEPAARALEESPIPWVAFVNGRAIGGGFELMLACDYRISASHASFRMPATHLSIPYGLEGIRRFVRLIGPSRTLDLFATARELPADRARELGLVDRIGDERLALEWARDVSQSGPLAMEYTKAAIRVLARGEEPSNLPHIIRLRQNCLSSRDLLEGIESVLERRLPRYEGR